MEAGCGGWAWGRETLSLLPLHESGEAFLSPTFKGVESRRHAGTLEERGQKEGSLTGKMDELAWSSSAKQKAQG